MYWVRMAPRRAATFPRPALLATEVATAGALTIHPGAGRPLFAFRSFARASVESAAVLP